MSAKRLGPRRAEQFTRPSAIVPWWLRAVNGLGTLMPGLYRPSASRWLSQARKEHPAASDPAPETVEAFEALVASLIDDAALSFSGRIAAGMDSVRMAAQHLQIDEAIRTQPEILDTQIPPPIFLVGWMRTGTTFVHRLLSCDPDSRFMPYWESMYPVPPGSGQGSDDRPAQLTKVLGQLEAISPNYQAIHPMSADAPEECVALFTNVFRTLQYNVQYRVPGYVGWLQQQDPKIAYRQYERQLRLVQFHRPHGQRFVLKDPTHSVFIDTIVELFPDARFVFTHREPSTTFSSMASLYAYSRAIFSHEVDPLSIGPELLDSYLIPTFERALQTADALPEGRVAHVRHIDVRRDPIGTMERAYQALGIELSPSARAGMQSMLDDEARKPRDVHIHSPEGFGLSAPRVRERLGSYCDRFDL